MTRVGLLAAVLLAIGGGGQLVIATQAAEPTAPMTVKVGPRSGSGAFQDTALVYLDGRIDAGAPDRLSKALSGISGKIAIWLNSPGGNLFAGMQLGRIIREHGASTHIINSGTLLPGECYSACALAFLGGVYRFNDNGARYGVHRASLPVDRATGEHDLGQELSAAIESYMREMGVDARLLELWAKAAPDEMYVLSRREAKDLRVVNDGQRAAGVERAPFPGGTMLQGRQATADGRGTVFFSCDEKQTTFGSVYEAADKGEAAAVSAMASRGDDRQPRRGSREAARGVQPGWHRPLDVSPAARSGPSRDVREADRSSHEALEPCPPDWRQRRYRRELCVDGPDIPG